MATKESHRGTLHGPIAFTKAATVSSVIAYVLFITFGSVDTVGSARSVFSADPLITFLTVSALVLVTVLTKLILFGWIVAAVIALARDGNWHRPITDLVFGLVFGALVFVYFSITDNTWFETMQAALTGATWGLTFAYLYWRFAGRPRPPYEAEEPAT